MLGTVLIQYERQIKGKKNMNKKFIIHKCVGFYDKHVEGAFVNEGGRLAGEGECDFNDGRALKLLSPVEVCYPRTDQIVMTNISFL